MGTHRTPENFVRTLCKLHKGSDIFSEEDRNILMIAILFIGAISDTANYCNESTQLEDGFVCCNNKLCSGYCHKFNHSDSETWEYREMCLDSLTKFTCIDAYGVFVWTLLIMLPSLLALVINPCLKTKASYVSILNGLLINIGIGFTFVGGRCLPMDMVAPLICFILGTTLFPLAYIFGRLNICNCFNGIKCCESCCGSKEDYSLEAMRAQQAAIMEAQCKCCECCSGCYECCYNCNVGCFDKTIDDNYCSWCKGPNDILAVAHELRSPYVTKEELRDVIYENVTIPPLPEVTAQAFYVTSDGKNQHTVVYASDKQPVDYTSWQDESARINLTDDPIVVYNCKVTYVFDQNMDPSIENATRVAEANVPKDNYVCSFLPHRLTGLTTNVVAGDEHNGFVSCCRSCAISGLLYEVLFFLGYHSLLEIVWRSRVTIISHKIMKRLSIEPGLRAQKGERDTSASNVGGGYKEDVKDSSLIYGMA